MLEALVDHIVEQWSVTAVLPRTEGRSGLDALIIVLEAIRGQYHHDPRSLRVLYALMFEAVAPGVELTPRFVEQHRNLRDSVAATIRRGIDDGSIIADAQPDAEADFIVSVLRAGYQWRLDPTHFDPVRSLDHLIATTRTRLRRTRRR